MDCLKNGLHCLVFGSVTTNSFGCISWGALNDRVSPGRIVIAFFIWTRTCLACCGSCNANRAGGDDCTTMLSPMWMVPFFTFLSIHYFPASMSTLRCLTTRALKFKEADPRLKCMNFTNDWKFWFSIYLNGFMLSWVDFKVQRQVWTFHPISWPPPLPPVWTMSKVLHFFFF